MDCLILGGGVIGLSLAYELAGHGIRARVVDRQELGREASWAGAGIIPAAQFLPGDFPLEQLAGLSCELHPLWAERLREETGIDNGYCPCGGIYLARDPETLHGLELTADDWYGREDRRSGGQGETGVERLDGRRLRALAPALGVSFEAAGWPDRVLAAYYHPEEAQLRNPRHVRALITACRQRGVELLPGTEVQTLHIERGRLAGVQTSAGRLSAETVVVTTGAWTGRLLVKVGITARITPVRGQIVLYRCPPGLLTPVVNDGPRYLVPRDDGRVLVGSTEEHAGFVKETTEEGIAGLMRFARELSPAVADCPVERTWAGLRPATDDGLPYLGRLPGLDNAFIAAGHFRSGLHLSTGTAVVMGQLLRGEQPAIDLRPFRCERHAADSVLAAR